MQGLPFAACAPELPIALRLRRLVPALGVPAPPGAHRLLVAIAVAVVVVVGSGSSGGSAVATGGERGRLLLLSGVRGSLSERVQALGEREAASDTSVGAPVWCVWAYAHEQCSQHLLTALADRLGLLAADGLRRHRSRCALGILAWLPVHSALSVIDGEVFLLLQLGLERFLQGAPARAAG